MKVSYACQTVDAVDAAALLLRRGNRQPELFLQRAREHAADRMTLPARRTRHFVDGSPLGSTQHRDHFVLLRRALRVGLRLWVRQRLDGRPQLIDQRLAVANLPPFLDTGQSIPQCQQSLAAEWRCVQLLVRSNGKLAFVECRRRVAAQRDSVIADDVDAHRWVLLIDPAATAAGDPHPRSLRRPKPLYSG